MCYYWWGVHPFGSILFVIVSWVTYSETDYEPGRVDSMKGFLCVTTILRLDLCLGDLETLSN